MEKTKTVRDVIALGWLPVYRAIKRLKKDSAAQLQILCFHHVSKSQWMAFERMLKYLIRYHIVITPAEAEAYINGKKEIRDKKRTLYLITFDDGFRSQYEVGAGILDRYGIKAVFFICPGIMDIAQESAQREFIAQNIFYPPVMAENVPDDMLMMSWENASYLHKMGHVIGAHTLFHKRLSALGGQKLQDEIVMSGKEIVKRLGARVNWFAYPFGDDRSVSIEAISVIRKHYEYCCSAIRGGNSHFTDPYGLLRQGIDLSRSFNYQKTEVEGGMDFIRKGAVFNFLDMVKKSTPREKV